MTAGGVFFSIGDFHENGNRYQRIHLQVITEKGLIEGFLHKGYCTAKDVPRMRAICPDPLRLLTGRLKSSLPAIISMPEVAD